MINLITHSFSIEGSDFTPSSRIKQIGFGRQDDEIEIDNKD